MPISINDPVFSTYIFIVIFVFALLVSLRQKKDQKLFPTSVTQELKGLAILAVVFAHIGYFLSTDNRFLFPLSIIAGVGVNLFLFLSGYGLTISTLKERLSISKFYRKRLLKLLTPFWVVTLIFFLLDFFVLHTSYPLHYVASSLLGFFPRADLFLDMNAPLWFLTPILFYYLIFPFVFSRKRPWLTEILVYAATYVILQLKLPVTSDVMGLYQLHLLAFPLGIAFAALFFKTDHFAPLASNKIRSFFSNPEQSMQMFNRLAYPVIIIALVAFIGFTAYHSGVGESQNKEQAISLINMIAIIFLFILMKFEIRLFYFFGLSSYEIYLFHWPLLSRYDFFFKHFPGWLAMILYLSIFLIFAWLLKKILNQVRRVKMLE